MPDRTRWSLRRATTALLATLAVVVLAVAAPGGLARAASPPAASARGLDVFVSGATSAAPGARLTMALAVVGYRTVIDAEPVEGAIVDLAWDPTQTHTPSPPVRVESDAGGRATATVVMPRTEGSARLLVRVQHETRTRTRTIEVGRLDPVEIDVIVPDTSVVPGTRVGAWLRLRDRAEGRRLAGIPVVAEMLDGGVARDRAHVTTDATGSALVLLRAPDLPDGAPVAWSLRAALADGSAARSVGLVPREEIPAQPDLDVAWDRDVVDAGGVATATVRLRDASGEPLAGEEVEHVVTPMSPDEETVDDWEAAIRARTDADGRVVIRWPVPPAIAGESLQVRVAVRTTVAERTLERSARLLVKRRGGSSFDAVPEAGALVPGIAQRIFLRARGDDGAPLVGPARALGDGLAIDVVLDARGEAEITWTPPPDVGSRRAVGPCARSVAATITLEAPGRLARTGDRTFACVVVDRAREAIVRVDPVVARAGQPVRVRVIPRVTGAAAGPTSIVVAPVDPELGAARAIWVADGEEGATIDLPAGPPGAWTVGAFTPRPGRPSLGAAASFLVAPALLPRIAAKVVGGRIAASGEVEIEARLADEAGRPVDGLVAAMVFDAFGGSSSRELERLDTRVALCEAAGVEAARCPDAWRGDAASAALVRSGLGRLGTSPDRVTPVLDPARTAGPELEAAFAATLRSLEGAVFEATSSPARLVDARRDGPRGRTFNPELFHIVTASLATPPTTPGGEPIELADLAAIDPQVQFDVVARRVTRLKVFRVLEQVRAHRHANDLDLDEPALADPDALLARLTASGELAPSALLDPWGGTLGFRRAHRARAPSIASLPGWELASPGPDGRSGTGDDVADPFARVVRSGSPYARALDEDAIVLARGDLRVAEETVRAWSGLLERNTGTVLGSAEGGEGHGRLGGSHRTRAPSVRMGATKVDRRAREPAWDLPSRTKDGVVRLRLPLGSVDTTYRVVVIGLADGGEPAVALVDVPVATPIAARIDAGDRWIEGDRVAIGVRVRNRTPSAARLVATVEAGGAAALVPGESPTQTLDVPARGAAHTSVRVRALRAGDATLAVTLRDVAGRVVDAVQTTIPVDLAGRRVEVSRARWVDDGTVDIPALALAPGERALGPTTLVVEGGVPETLAAALVALEPDRLATADALVDAMETASRVALHAAEHPGGAPIARRAAGVLDRARGRLLARRLDVRTAEVRRAQLFTDLPGLDRAAAPCDADAPPVPEDGPRRRGRDLADDVARGIALLEAEPASSEGAGSSCWEATASDVADDVGQRGDPVEMARLVLAFAERPHRRDQATVFATRLGRLVALSPSGRIALPAPYGARREARAVVLAALMRAAAAGIQLPAPREALLGWLLVQRDATGGFGSPAATRAAVAAIVADAPARRGAPGAPVRGAPEVAVVELDDEGDPTGAPRRLRAPAAGAAGAASIRIAPTAASVQVTAQGGALVRLERVVLRPSTPSAELLEAPLRLAVEWPERPRVAAPGVVRVAVRSTRAHDARALVRIPLPAGVSLAEPVDGVRAVPGALLVELTAEADDTPLPTRIPVRFALAGDLGVPEASARLADEGGAPAHARAPRLSVRR